LTESYFFAIPFFRNTIFGDLFYSGVFFGGYEFVKKLTFNTSPLWAWRRFYLYSFLNLCNSKRL
jgi:hypothetical protein